ncbi:hypothetical protein [Flammeovirga pacifica]|uniref:DUF6311 domain-containing protein n=1 Tax=Flammeovirga pacifica TaxID=915059 RepID=A0A1S1Z0V8_FLAPC|nr:hypothetical protein [Flammeovirga pacifica]OHX66882.1 hypothetical protein NH26_11205 [Flammeovirga pacifica]
MTLKKQLKELSDKNINFIGLCILTIIISIIYKDVLLHPNSTLNYDDSVDGLKNYFIFIWLAKFGHANAMNYPFGEIILLTDSIPILSYPIYLLKYIGLDLNQYSIGILHLSMFLCYPISYLASVRVFKHYNCSAIYSNIFALIITLGNPVNCRILKHYGLFFFLITPLLILLIIKFLHQKNYKYLFWIFIMNFSGYYIHGYVGMLWCGLTLFIFSFTLFSNTKNRKKLFLGILSVIIATALYYLSVKITDDHLWRSKTSFVLFDFGISLKIIFEKFFPGTIDINNSLQFNYFFWSLCITTTYILIKKRKKVLKIDLTLITFTLTAIIFLMYGATVFIRFKWVLALIPPLEQIRELVRFGWVFYLLIFIPFLVVNYKYLNKKILLPILFLGMIESIMYQKEIMNISLLDENIFLEDKSVKKIDTTNIDAIYANYTNNIWNKANENRFLNKLLYSFSYKTGIPCINTHYSRLSEEEWQLQSQLYTQGIEKSKLLFNRIQLDNKILVISYEKNIPKHWNLLKKLDSKYLYSIPIHDFIPPNTSLNSLKTGSIWNENPNYELSTKSAIKISKRNSDILTVKIDSLEIGQQYELTFWGYHYKMDSLSCDRLVLLQDNHRIGYNKNVDVYEVTANQWGMLSIPFIPKSNSDIKVRVINRIQKSPYYYDKIFNITYEQKDRKQPLLFTEFNVYKK